jgi:uncharacterized protein (DUF433 family)
MSQCGICGKDTVKIEPSRVVFNPMVAMPGMPTIDDNRIGVLTIGKVAWEHGIAYVHGPEMYPHLRREQVITACWWLGTYGAKAWRKRWDKWAWLAYQHLWYGCGNVPELPTKPKEKP